MNKKNIFFHLYFRCYFYEHKKFFVEKPKKVSFISFVNIFIFHQYDGFVFLIIYKKNKYPATLHEVYK